MKNTLLYLFLILLLTNCNDDVPLSRFESKMVIYAELSNTSTPYVSIQKTVPLLAMSNYPGVGNATVKITDLTLNKTYTLWETSEGIYNYDSTIGFVGHSYRLDIEVEGERITAIEKMPQIVELQNATVEKYEVPFVEDKNYIEIKPKFYDPKGIENYYQFVFFKNYFPIEKSEIFKDYGFDGLQNVIKFIIEGKTDEYITVRMRNITKNAYIYLEGVKLNQNQIAATPTNPVTNLTGNTLGYFNVFSDGGEVNISPKGK
ncbi:DUF4249 domain-containing protein [Weeksellaceae bacterium TAE3-ERU29]|nr:DUF4249 domain-containing protein [Weeksellaceae bacterium TAE3-ERU29]